MKRAARFQYGPWVELGAGSPLTVRAYGRRGRYVCTLYISGAGVGVHVGKKRVGDVVWEELLDWMMNAKGGR